MAKATIIHHWGDGGATQLEVSAQGQHPDLLDELCTRVVRLWRETCEGAEAEAETEAEGE